MTTSASDISVVLSGGSINIDPDLSLGGDPSSSPIMSGSLNNLFADISKTQAKDGYEDYRCIYLFNDGDSTVYEVKLWIQSDFAEGSVMEIGVESRDELQRITLSDGPVTGGTLTISYRGENFTTTYNADLGAWATSIQDSFNGLPTLHDVAVVGQNAGSGTVVFDIRFTERDGQRNHATIAIDSNDLTPPTVDVTVSTIQQGAPVNTVASEIDVETTPPGLVTFYAASETSPIALPSLEPNEGFPLWIKRTTDAETAAKEDDGFSLRFSANSLEPTV